jgi:hypothetical protein
MPAVSEKQRKFMGAELGRKRAGRKTETGMSEPQLREFASKRGKKKKRGNPDGETAPPPPRRRRRRVGRPAAPPPGGPVPPGSMVAQLGRAQSRRYGR